MADNVIGCAVESAVPAEEAAPVARDYAAPALAGARRADEVGRRGEAQEHQLEKIVQEDVNLGRRRGSPPGILAAAATAPHGLGTWISMGKLWARKSVRGVRFASCSTSHWPTDTQSQIKGFPKKSTTGTYQDTPKKASPIWD